MAGLVPAIPNIRQISAKNSDKNIEMPGTRPGMTRS
jgi:hypothetical protein